MCLAVPVRVQEIIDAQTAIVSADGILREADITLIDELSVGDYVILHVGYALSKLDEAEALQTLQAMTAAGLLPNIEQDTP